MIFQEKRGLTKVKRSVPGTADPVLTKIQGFPGFRSEVIADAMNLPARLLAANNKRIL